MPKKRGTRSGLRREFRVVRSTALRKLRRSKVDLNLNELEVLAQQIRADRQNRCRNWNSFKLSHCRCNSSRVLVDMDKRHMQEIQQRDLQLAEMRGTLTALNTRGSRLGPGRSDYWIQRFSTMCNLPTGNGRRGKPSCSNGEPTSSLRTGSIESFWTKSTTQPKTLATAIWTSRIRN